MARFFGRLFTRLGVPCKHPVTREEVIFFRRVLVCAVCGKCLSPHPTKSWVEGPAPTPARNSRSTTKEMTHAIIDRNRGDRGAA